MNASNSQTGLVDLYSGSRNSWQQIKMNLVPVVVVSETESGKQQPEKRCLITIGFIANQCMLAIDSESRVYEPIYILSPRIYH